MRSIKKTAHTSKKSSLKKTNTQKKKKDSIWGCGKNDYGQLCLGDKKSRDTFSEIVLGNQLTPQKVVTSDKSTMILTNCGKILVCGNNESGNLGLGKISESLILQMVSKVNVDGEKKPISKIIDMTLNEDYSFILSEDRTLFSCGKNENGQLGLGNNINQNMFTKLSSFPKNVTIKEIICGIGHSLVLSVKGEVFACGQNDFGQLGLGDTINCR